METTKDLRENDLMDFVGPDGEFISVVKVHKIIEEDKSVEIDLGNKTYVIVGPDALDPIPANRDEIWEQNGFIKFAEVCGKGTSAYYETIGPRISPYPVTEFRNVMVIICESYISLVFHDKTNPLLPEGKQQMKHYTYLHEVQHAYQDNGYIKEWEYERTGAE